MKRLFFLTVALLLVLDTASWLAFGHITVTNSIFLVTLGLLAGAAWKRPWILGFAMVAELAVGGKGHLLDFSYGGFELSLRLGLFCLLWLAIILRWKLLRPNLPPKTLWLWPGMLTVWVGLMTLWGIAQGYPLSRVFFDMNGFLYLAALPGWWIIWREKKDWLHFAIAVLLAGVTLTGIKSAIVVGFFAQGEYSVSRLYQWINQTGIGETTFISTELYRVFLQSQLYGLLAGCFLLGLMWAGEWRRWMWIPWVFACASVWISLSRSFWLGLAAAGIMSIVLFVRDRDWKKWKMITLRGIGGIALGYLLFSWAIHFPSPVPLRGGGGNPVANRLGNQDSASASTARRNQIQPLLSEISKQPVIGRGFGATARYLSTDPRINGWRETSAFELGYLDWWLKMGMIGLVLLGGWLWTLTRRAWHHPWRLGILTSLVALCAVHLTSPYLNHPLGLGWLIFLSLLLYSPRAQHD